ncbi:MAG TPA: hypothetical protein VGS04_04875 [Nitrososphaerales archaeon]|nr:hypothetical protein [Nitrososphaerales archaeon]
MRRGASSRKLMPERKKGKRKGPDEVDSFETWIEKQPAKPALAKHGFVADAKIEGSG